MIWRFQRGTAFFVALKGEKEVRKREKECVPLAIRENSVYDNGTEFCCRRFLVLGKMRMPIDSEKESVERRILCMEEEML